MSRSIGAAMLVLALLPRPASADEAGEAAIRKIIAGGPMSAPVGD